MGRWGGDVQRNANLMMKIRRRLRKDRATEFLVQEPHRSACWVPHINTLRIYFYSTLIARITLGADGEWNLKVRFGGWRSPNTFSMIQYVARYFAADASVVAHPTMRLTKTLGRKRYVDNYLVHGEHRYLMTDNELASLLICKVPDYDWSLPVPCKADLFPAEPMPIIKAALPFKPRVPVETQ